MTTKDKSNTIKKKARVAGFLYLLLVPFSIFGFFYVPSNLVVAGDVGATAINIVASEGLFRAGIVSWLIGQAIFIVLVVALYNLLKPINNTHASIMVAFALVGVPIAFITELTQFGALLLLSSAGYLAAFEDDQLHAQVKLFLDLHEHGIFIAQIFWGLWLFPFGYLVFKSGFLPRILGILLMIGCFGYLIDTLAFFLFPDFDTAVAPFTSIGEFLFPLWLVFKGIDVEQWEKRALESA